MSSKAKAKKRSPTSRGRGTIRAPQIAKPTMYKTVRDIVPRELVISLPYTEVGVISPGAQQGAIRWKTNSYSPSFATSAAIPGLDAYSRLYSYYRPLKYVGSITCTNTVSVPCFLFFVHQVSDPTASFANQQAQSGNRYGATATLGALGSGHDQFVHRFSHRHVDIVGSVTPDTDDSYAGSIINGSLTAPSDLNYFGVAVSNTSSNAGVAYNLRMYMVWRLYDPQAMYQ